MAIRDARLAWPRVEFRAVPFVDVGTSLWWRAWAMVERSRAARAG